MSTSDVIPQKRVLKKWLRRHRQIKARCTDEDHRGYPNYGGRGIKMHEPWLDDVESFLRFAVTLVGWNDLNLELDREDVDGHYEPGNLRMLSRKKNAANKRNSTRVRYRGRDYGLVEFAETFLPTKPTSYVRRQIRDGVPPETLVANDGVASGLRDLTYLSMCTEAAVLSKDPDTQIGACVTDGGVPLAFGYNSPAKHLDDDLVVWERPAKYAYVVHAETNAMLFALSARKSPMLDGCTLYCTGQICSRCCLLAIHLGITRIVCGAQKPRCCDAEDVERVHILLAATHGRVTVEMRV